MVALTKVQNENENNGECTYKGRYNTLTFSGRMKRTCTVRGHKLDPIIAVDITVAKMDPKILYIQDVWMDFYIKQLRLHFKRDTELGDLEYRWFRENFKRVINDLLRKLHKINGRKAPPMRIANIDHQFGLTVGEHFLVSFLNEKDNRDVGSDKLFAQRIKDYSQKKLKPKHQDILNQIGLEAVQKALETNNNPRLARFVNQYRQQQKEEQAAKREATKRERVKIEKRIKKLRDELGELEDAA